ncbi:tetratricopeptide repeat protein [Bacillus gaemokensis]|uniref:Histidine kinase n=1 Tax=Bacillus gaemokensis TaxID=574375 RepID=A0A073KI30_9BACI|nr:tetratricopeptide repeat protein [Bacillus gaemokensis]KEK26102.1 histidine kinase [Bacillus gaemokensis]KYG38912.1 histidine kinase [Bacillus gaemokensis]
MNVSLKRNEQVTKIVNDWYHAMLQQQVLKATNLKREIDEQINILKKEENIEQQDQNLLLYYSLLDFRYKVLTDGLSITKDSFDIVESYDIPSDNLLNYYYHFFKAIHATLTTHYNEANEYYEKAEKLLKHVPDDIERAEFYYRFSAFFYYTTQPMNTIKYVSKVKEIFLKHTGYEISVALSENLLGLTAIQIGEYAQAEEHLNSAINSLQKQNDETLLLRVRHNLGWLYSSQNLSSLAIRHLSEVTTKMPTHFKALFLQAREHHKLGETNIAEELVTKGLKICNEIENVKYIHHFTILKALNNNVPVEELEKIICEGITYFDTESLYNYTQEYAEKLAVKFYEENNYMKASKYFYIGLQAKEKTFEKGALK